MQIKMEPKVEAMAFSKLEEASKWLEGFLLDDNKKVFHILQSESIEPRNDDYASSWSMTYTVVYAVMPELSDEQKEQKEKVEAAVKMTQEAANEKA